MSEPNKLPSPPSWASKLLEWVCPDELLEEIGGDLQELFEERIEEVGEKQAGREYVLAVLGYCRPFAFKKQTKPTTKPLYTDMLLNYIKIALRSFQKNRIYSFINLTGLSVACAFCLLVYTFVQHELSFDRFHQKASSLYRLEIKGLGEVAEMGTRSFLSNLTTPDKSRLTRVTPDLAPELQAIFPEVKQISRLMDNYKQIMGVGDKRFHQDNIYLADSNFFDVFSFRLLKGNPKTALSDPQSIVLSEKVALRYFGGKDPIGQRIDVLGDGANHIFTVTGIVENAPSNSSLAYEVLVPLNSKLSPVSLAPKQNLNMLFTMCIVELDAKTDIAAFKHKLKTFGQNYYKDELVKRNVPIERLSLVLTPLTETHLDSIPWGWPRMGKKLNIYVLSLITLFVLVIASLNYIFLSLSHASARLQEMGVRKVNGASRLQLIMQLWTETFMLVLFSMGAGFILSYLLLPVFNTLLDSGLETHLLYSLPAIGAALMLAFVISLLTGIYPALLLSAYNPVRLLKRHSTYRINPTLSRFMVVVQYALCLFLVITTVIMKEQFNYLTHKNLGFDKENLLVINLMENQSMSKGAFLLDKFKAMARTQPDIVAVSGGDNMTRPSMIVFFTINNQPAVINKLSGDYDYVQMMGLHMMEGRTISPQFPTDTSGTGAIIINEQLAKLIGNNCKVGTPCKELDNAVIVGIVKDFHFASLSQPIGPAMLHYNPKYIPNILIKIRPGNIPATIASIEQTWKQVNEGRPLNYTFMDEDIANMYQAQQTWMNIIEAASWFAILVACLGLFGLSGLNAVNRTKEIGIRKILGASVGQIFLLLNTVTIRLAFVSFLIAFPLAYYIGYHWLEDFTYRIDMSWKIFAIAGAAGLLIVLIAVSYYSIKAAIANPVNSLRNE
ncbi:FtsX-like permease family protein [Rhodocytophaga rosea]|uniref:FtsX-like permease family protein n=1 Tax=Rhodocytophaga rosea TaxID=2704465 RepID=A0A6C0GJJ2_9BACT|nr:FtsX-like permease family protein [Rhodocytophaga rosea]QHT67800.1 FtsX-like permease family protein [Rhodocytophaga rosea]